MYIRQGGRGRVYKRERERESLLTRHDPLVENEKVNKITGPSLTLGNCLSSHIADQALTKSKPQYYHLL